MKKNYIAGKGYCKVPHLASKDLEMGIECESNLGLYGVGIWIAVGPAKAVGRWSDEECHENGIKLTIENARLFIKQLNAEISETEKVIKEMAE